MHALSHSLQHRAPLTRTRLRWQPYAALPTRSPIYINTPLSTSTSSPLNTTQPRDPQKNKLILGLVGLCPLTHYSPHSLISLLDQAVTSLCDIWPHQDIPSVFLVSAQPSVSVALAVESLSSMVLQPGPLRTRNAQLPSPITPSSSRSPISISPLSAPSPSTAASSRSSTDSATTRSNLVPIRGFVHEVLRRSRTSGTVLQTASCYLEAIRSKVPNLVRRERSRDGSRGEPGYADRILVAVADTRITFVAHVPYRSIYQFVFCTVPYFNNRVE